MKYYLSTISDVIYSWDEETNKENVSYEHITGPIAAKYGLGLELAEYCISSNCDEPETVRPFFNENANNYGSDLIIHAPYNELLPHAIEPEVVRIAWKRYTECYKLAEAVGAKKMVAHANYNKLLYFPSWFKQKQVEFWKRFLEKNKGSCIIVLENVMEHEPCLITDIIKSVDNPRLRMCLDVGHANLHPGKSVYQWLDECGPYISHLHIHNNNGPAQSDNAFAGTGDLHKGLDNGIIDYARIVKCADEMNIEGLTATIESIEAEESIKFLIENNFI